MNPILVGIAIVLLLYYLLLNPQLYWRWRNVKQGPPIPILGDVWRNTFRLESVVEFVDRLYKSFKGERYVGVYQASNPVLMIRDPELIKQITVKDFDHFVDHVSFAPENIEPVWSRNLFSLKGDKWRTMRATLSPTFTASKMRLMFALMENSAVQYVEFYEQQCQKNKGQIELELKDSLSRFANDVIANCAFGVTVDSLQEPSNDFYLKGVDISSFINGTWKTIKFLIAAVSPKIAGRLRIKIFNPDSTAFFKTLVRDAVKVREDKNIVRPDMINLLMEARRGKLHYEESEHKDAGFSTMEESDIGKNKNIRQNTMSDDDMTAQVLIFFFAGFETISTMMSLMYYELAINPDIQEKLREEVDTMNKQCNGRLTYDFLNKMKYLDMVISESLRKHPPVITIDRMCTKPYTIQPERFGEHPVRLEPGQSVIFPVYGIHHDAEFYPNPDKFDPERFSDENKSNIRSGTFLSFGGGPRNCIGSRFALMEIKTLVFHLLTRFEVIVVGKTTIPLKYNKHQFNPTVEGGCWVGLKHRQSV